MIRRHECSDPPAQVSSSTLIYTGHCIFHGFLLGTDGVNNPTITIYNNTTNSGDEVVPTAEYDASLLGLNGVSGLMIYCDHGLYVEISGATCEVSIFYKAL